MLANLFEICHCFAGYLLRALSQGGTVEACSVRVCLTRVFLTVFDTVTCFCTPVC